MLERFEDGINYIFHVNVGQLWRKRQRDNLPAHPFGVWPLFRLPAKSLLVRAVIGNLPIMYPNTDVVPVEACDKCISAYATFFLIDEDRVQMKSVPRFFSGL
jgi:hypothetical protein